MPDVAISFHYYVNHYKSSLAFDTIRDKIFSKNLQDLSRFVVMIGEGAFQIDD